MANNTLGMLDFIEGGPVGSFVKEVFKKAEQHADKGDQDTAKEFLDACEDTLLAYKRACMMTEIMEEREGLLSKAESLVNDHVLTKQEKTKLDDEMNSAKAKRSRKLIEGILNDDKESS
tara:strand:+ start:579 stop:935 length:357 start_codon:yes stop_codon:yes gene_type:complete